MKSKQCLCNLGAIVELFEVKDGQEVNLDEIHSKAGQDLLFQCNIRILY